MKKASGSDDFGKFTHSERRLIYLGLLTLVKSNSGYGFCNGEQGHAAYVVGRSGKWDYNTWGDSPEHNMLFKMMHTLSVSLVDSELDGSSEVSEYVFSWSDFCNIAHTAYEENKNNTPE